VLGLLKSMLRKSVKGRKVLRYKAMVGEKEKRKFGVTRGCREQTRERIRRTMGLGNKQTADSLGLAVHMVLMVIWR